MGQKLYKKVDRAAGCCCRRRTDLISVVNYTKRNAAILFRFGQSQEEISFILRGIRGNLTEI